jgi:hypothetical protein
MYYRFILLSTFVVLASPRLISLDTVHCLLFGYFRFRQFSAQVCVGIFNRAMVLEFRLLGKLRSTGWGHWGSKVP